MSRIRLEWVPIPLYGLGLLGFDHLQITYEYDGAASQDQWYVIEGTFAGPIWKPTLFALGEDGETTLAQANTFSNTGLPRYGQDLIDKIGTPYTRGSRGLPVLDTLSTWESMAASAGDFDGEFYYSILGIPTTAQPTSNSSSLVASVLHYAGIDISNHNPFGMRRTSGMHTLLGTQDNDVMKTTNNFTTLQAGRGNDQLSGTDRSERFYGGLGDDLIMWSKGYNLVHGGQWRVPYGEDGTDTVDYSGGGVIIIQKSFYHFEHVAPDYVVRVYGGAVDHLYSIERVQWSAGSDTLQLEDVEVLEDGLLFRMGAESSPQGDRAEFASLSQGLLINPTSVTGQLMVQAASPTAPTKASWIESVEYVVGSAFADRIYLDDTVRVVEAGGGNDLVDARLATPFEGASPQGYDAELSGGAGNDTLVANAGRILMTGGEGADSFIVTATSTTQASPVEIVIEGADSADRLYIPYALFNGTGGTFEGSQLMPVLGGIGQPGQAGSGVRAYFDWLTETQRWNGSDMSQGIITFVGWIDFDLAGSDLLVHVYRGQKVPFDNGNGGIVLEVLPLESTETIIRVKDFQAGELGINFYDPGTPVPQQLANGQWVLHYPNYDSIVATLTNNGNRLAALEARPTAVEMPPPEAAPPPPVLGTEGNDLIAPLGNTPVAVQAGGGSDTVTSGAGNDTLDGGSGTDTMTGGSGNDTYIVETIGDVVVEAAGGGSDTIFSAINLTLGGNVENLVLMDVAASGIGNTIANMLGGSDLANQLSGLGGNDTLIGGAGNDTLIGGTGSDTYGYALGEGVDVINDQGLAGDVDVLMINHGVSPAEVTFARPLSGSPQDLLVQFADGGRILLQGFSGAVGSSIEQIWFGDGTRWLRPDLNAFAAAALTETNVAPVAVDDSQMGLTVASMTVPASILLGNDYDVNGDTLTISGVGGAVGCVVTLLANGDLQIDAPTGYQGLATFSYTISDGHGGTATAWAEFATGLGGPSDTLTGTASSDSLTGQASDETLLGMGGDDTLEGGGGGDLFDGGSGFDWVSYANAASGIGIALDNSVAPIGAATGATLVSIEAVIGTAYSDTLFATNVANALRGEAGQDDLMGGAGNDTLDGGTQMDGLIGNGGNDTLIGGDHVDSILADAGNDLIDGATGETTPYGDQLSGGIGDDTFIVYGDDAVLEYVSEGTDLVLARTSYQLDSGAHVETLRADSATVVTLTGNEFGQTLANNPGAAAELVGSGGADTILGGTAGEALYGDFAGATGAGVAGADLIQAGDGNDTAYGEAGNDTLQGGADNDVLIGGAGNDNLQGGHGNDMLDGLTGEASALADSLAGGSGDDTYLVLGNDIVTELAGEGNDTLLAMATFTLAAGQQVESLHADHAAVATLTGNELGQTLANNPGAAATLVGGGGNDTILGGAANETLWGDFAGSTGPGVAGADLIQAGGGNDSVRGEAGNDTLQGDAGTDTLIGGLGLDSLVGGDGADRLDGVTDETTAAIDTLVGGLGNDTHLVNGTDLVVEAAGGGSDLVSARSNHTLAAGAEIEQLSADVANITLMGNELGQSLVTSLTTVARLRGGGGNDTITGSTAGNDVLYGDFANGTGPGAAGNDSMAGGGGNDSLYGEAGDDTLLGQDGIDRLQGGTGNDSADGGLGNDLIYGEAGDDTLWGQLGDDALYGGINNDVLNGGDGLDALRGEAGNDTMTGGAGNDTFYFVTGFGRDTILDLAAGDIINLQGFAATYANLVFTNVGANVEISSTKFGAVTNVIVVANDSGPVDPGHFVF